MTSALVPFGGRSVCVGGESEDEMAIGEEEGGRGEAEGLEEVRIDQGEMSMFFGLS